MRILKKDFIKTAIFSVIVSFFTVLAVLELKKFQKEEETKEAKSRVVQFGSNEIKQVKFKNYFLEKDNKKPIWKMVSPYTDYLNYRVTEEWILKGLSQKGRNLSDGEEPLNWADFSLDNELNKIVYITNLGEETLVQLSEKEAFDGSAYLKVKFKGMEKLYSSSSEWKEVFSKKVEKLRSLQLFNWEVAYPLSLLKKISFYKRGKVYFSLIKKDVWTSSELKDWSFDEAKVDSYINELKTYLHEGFSEKKVSLKDKTSSIVINIDREGEFSLNFYKKNYAISSYRPEHTLNVDKGAESTLMVNPLDLRSFKDVDGDVPNGDIDKLNIRVGKQSQTFQFKDNIWVLGRDEKKQDNFNGARVFVFLNKLKEINYKRFVSDKNFFFKSANKKIYLMKNGKNLVKYSVGQNVKCEKESKLKQCVLIATNQFQKAYVIALKQEVNEIFKFKFYDEVK